MISDTLPSGAANKQFDSDTKFKVLNRGSLLAPACCSSCGGSDPERYYIDFDLFVDYYGQVYLCNNCVSDAAEKIGLLNETEIEFLKNQVNKSAEELAELNNRYEAEHERLQHFESLFGDRSSSDSNYFGDGVSDPIESESESVTESVIEIGEEQSEVTESTESEGLTKSLRSERDDGSSESGIDL